MKIVNCKLKNSGFTLVEVTVALLIVGVMLVLLEAVIHSSVLVRISKNQGIALSVAKNELESLRTLGYAALPASGSFTNDLMGTLPTAATTMLTVSDYNEKTKQVTVDVIWKDPGSAASSTVSLGTLITEIGGLP